jgi:hypothetical protein
MLLTISAAAIIAATGRRLCHTLLPFYADFTMPAFTPRF